MKTHRGQGCKREKKEKGKKKKRLYVLITFSGAWHDGVTFMHFGLMILY